MKEEIVVGDTVVRCLAGIDMELLVTSVTPTIIRCGPWEFDRQTWNEIDPFFTMPQSYLKGKAK